MPTVSQCTRWFAAYGMRVGLRIADSYLRTHVAPVHLQELPPGWRPDSRDAGGAAVLYEVDAAARDGLGPHYTLRIGADVIAVDEDPAAVLRAFSAHAEFLIAQCAPDHLFVHSGVVGWQGRAVLIPGRSFSGKTTLVRAFLEVGATYYSDEYAVLDREGRVHPYPRPLVVRHALQESAHRVPAERLGARIGVAALPVGLVLVTAYRNGASWRPRSLPPAQSLLALMANTVAAQGSPAHSMPILRRAVADAFALKGVRGEASALVTACARRLNDMNPGQGTEKDHDAPAKVIDRPRRSDRR